MAVDNSPSRTGEPRLASVASWAVLAASFGLSASTWVALAVLAGFTDTIPIPFTDARFALAWLMPIAVDGYVVVALVLWMSPVSAPVAAFAKKNTYFAAGTGIVAQSAYHLLDTLSTNVDLWRVVLAAIVGALPPTVAGLAVHMRALIRRESGTTATPGMVSAPVDRDCRHELHGSDGGRCPGCGWDAVPIPTQPARVVPLNLPPLPAVPEPIPGPATGSPTTDPHQADPAPPEQARPEIPTPAQVATRITPPRTNQPTAPAAAPRQAAHPTGPRPSNPVGTPVSKLAPSTTDPQVIASDAAQPELPIVSPDLLARATRVARQYRTEHDTPITAGQLAVRLKVTSELATQALTLITLDANPTANGRPMKATR